MEGGKLRRRKWQFSYMNAETRRGAPSTRNSMGHGHRARASKGHVRKVKTSKENQL